MFFNFLSKSKTSYKRILTIFLFLNPNLFSQQREFDFDNFIQELFSIQDQKINYDDIYESVLQYYRKPINLNNATRQQLADLYILSELQINSFFDYIEKNGKLLSIFELQAIPHFDLQTIEKLLPLVYVPDYGFQFDNRSLWQRIKEEENHYLILRLERQIETRKGFTTSTLPSQRYQGDPYKIYGRYRIQHFNDFSIGITFEKDPGEVLEWKPDQKVYGFDFISYHVMLKNKNKIKSWIVGDYQMQFGQGLVLSSGFFLGKGAETITTVRRNNIGIRPYTSVLESNFMRGMALTYQLFPKITITPFISSVYSDGKITSSENDTLGSEQQFLNAVYQTGLHRTEKERTLRMNFLKNEYGGNVTFNLSKNLHIGFNHLTTAFLNPSKLNRSRFESIFFHKENEKLYLKKNHSIYNQFEFSGTINRISSVDYQYIIQNFNFFGEFAVSSSKGTGLVNGFLASLSPQLDISMLYRNYARSFHSFYGNAFGEGMQNINERGLYTGIKYQHSRKWIISAFFDTFRYPWLSYRAYNPIHGYEYLIRITHKPTKKISLYLQIRKEKKDRNLENNQTVSNFTTHTTLRNILVNIDFNEDKFLSLRTRYQQNQFYHGHRISYGSALIQDITYSWKKKIKIQGRFALFQTDDYDSRIYVYENDVLYNFTIPAYHGTGIRNYLIINYKISPKMEIWFRFARTTYRYKNSIGTGSEQIWGNRDSDWKLQVRWLL